MQTSEVSEATVMQPVEWTFADVWETIADAIPDRVALAHGDRHVTWREFDRRADGPGSETEKASNALKGRNKRWRLVVAPFQGNIRC